MNCIKNGIDPNVIPKYDKDETVFTIDYEEAEIDEEIKASTEPEDIEKCLKAGVLPDCYKNSNITVEVQSPDNISCFTKNADGTVTCPTGNIMTCVRHRGNCDLFTNKDACRQCKRRCKASGTHKVVSMGPETTVVPVKMYGHPEGKLNRITCFGTSSYNHTLDRSDYTKNFRVVVHVKHDEKITKLRKTIVEHPFGTVKWSDGAYYVLCRGIKKATAELGLSFLAYNLKRAINMVGVRRLIEEM